MPMPHREMLPGVRGSLGMQATWVARLLGMQATWVAIGYVWTQSGFSGVCQKAYSWVTVSTGGLEVSGGYSWVHGGSMHGRVLGAGQCLEPCLGRQSQGQGGPVHGRDRHGGQGPRVKDTGAGNPDRVRAGSVSEAGQRQP